MGDPDRSPGETPVSGTLAGHTGPMARLPQRALNGEPAGEATDRNKCTLHGCENRLALPMCGQTAACTFARIWRSWLAS